ncbi:DUF6355 family natural product biosynthesis protein [Saccharothrix longispora]|uniref:DUF6355 family natural product biosynthesis protein n=1 Tax=Saccharothrix longispora TaxID=33920 RepID=UPI0028FD69DB|nr:DUF6355 family natural product biosynthesis protein [Saccharothrix longispora]MDU0294814.1 DUF6355 family natural product biosynthesis protein [Saccharothrix longispora]
MTRTFVMRLLGIVGLALGLTMAVSAASASAQIAMGGPYGPAGENGPRSQIQTRPDVFQPPYSAPGSQIQSTDAPGSQIQKGPQNGAVSTQGASAAASCGFFIDTSDRHHAKYNHCGWSQSIKIRVNFWYGWSTRDIWVGRYTTNLSTHWQLQGAGMVTNAWCVQNC